MEFIGPNMQVARVAWKEAVDYYEINLACRGANHFLTENGVTTLGAVYYTSETSVELLKHKQLEIMTGNLIKNKAGQYHHNACYFIAIGLKPNQGFFSSFCWMHHWNKFLRIYEVYDKDFLILASRLIDLIYCISMTGRVERGLLSFACRDTALVEVMKQ